DAAQRTEVYHPASLGPSEPMGGGVARDGAVANDNAGVADRRRFADRTSQRSEIDRGAMSDGVKARGAQEYEQRDRRGSSFAKRCDLAIRKSPEPREHSPPEG
ncbi:MAG TPA: hypothetical protein VKH42_14425, partial [Vicinamibacterales bacterium]|nr:hypothetical protein [Vicinamibacterales bacterium]